MKFRSDSNSITNASEESLKERYVIQKVIGEGGFSMVYQAWDQLLYRDVAIKKFVYEGDESQKERCRKAFISEKALMQALSNIPYIPRILDEFSENDSEYLVLTLLSGCSLLDYVRSIGGTLPASELFHLMERCIYALECMHEQGYIHRDISPKNMFITKDKELFLIDFGTASALDPDSPLYSNEVFEHRGFHCPEYAMPALQGPWSDVYSLCATIFYLLTGEGIPSPEIRRNFDEVPQLLTRCHLSTRQQNALLSGLQPDPEKRKINACDLRIALCQELYQSPSSWKLEYAVKTDIGDRPMNQDNMTIDGLFCYEGIDLDRQGCLACQPGEIHLAAVCDGVGGAAAGELSAKAAIQALTHFMESHHKSTVLPEVLLEDLMNQMNEKIVSLSDKIGKTGSTVSIVMWKGKHYYTVNIGDSPIYLLHKKKLTRLSTPHTLAEQKKKAGELYSLSDRHVLTSYLGKRYCAGGQMMSLTYGHLEENDTFLICSDGVTEIIPEEKIRHYMIKSMTKAEDGIWKLVRKKKNRDNCSTVLLRFTSGE